MAFESRIHLGSLYNGCGNIWGHVFAMFLDNSNSVDYKPEYPEAMQPIAQNACVDHQLVDSRDTVEEAVRLTVAGSGANNKAGF